MKMLNCMWQYHFLYECIDEGIQILIMTLLNCKPNKVLGEKNDNMQCQLDQDILIYC